MTEPLIEIEQGKILGKEATNIKNGVFYCFQGIPYAKPPIGKLRFKAPQPPEPWSGIRDCTKHGEQCYARHQIFKEQTVGSEDCLFLNVYTPNLPKPKNESFNLKPVMVWIHGGAFTHGSGNTDLYGPEFLLTEDIVLVTINYRIGILGFLNFKDTNLSVPGNAGLKDMVQALKWVQNNIEKFLGDPKNVTIFGESAGGSSVHYLMLSQLGKGLFHKVIAQSGTALNLFARGRNLNTELATVLKLDSPSEEDLLEKLLPLPVEELLIVSEQAAAMCNLLINAGDRHPFAPVVEVPSDEAFITEEPITIIKSGKYHHVPLILGYTSREGMLIEAKIKPLKPTMPSSFENLFPFLLNVDKKSEQGKMLATQIKNFYYSTSESESDPDNFYLIHTDNYFLREIIFAVVHHCRTSTAPVYLYRMSVESKLNLYKGFANITTPGVSHGDDIGYLFKTHFTPPLQEKSLEEKAVRNFIKLWTNFAKTGNPNSKELKINWQPIQNDALKILDIGEELTVKDNPDNERIEFWNNLFKSVCSDYAF